MYVCMCVYVCNRGENVKAFTENYTQTLNSYITQCARSLGIIIGRPPIPKTLPNAQITIPPTNIPTSRAPYAIDKNMGE